MGLPLMDMKPSLDVEDETQNLWVFQLDEHQIRGFGPQGGQAFKIPLRLGTPTTKPFRIDHFGLQPSSWLRASKC